MVAVADRSAAPPLAHDGRRARRHRNRDAVVDAMLELYREGLLKPSSDQIAARAGLSPRSLFRYFDDIDDLCRAAIARHLERIRPVLAVRAAPDAPLAERIDALAEQRLKLFEAIGAVGVVSRLRAPFEPVIEAQLREARAYLRRQVRSVLAPELDALGEGSTAALAALDVVCSFESHQLLRFDQRLSKAKTKAVVVAAMTAMVQPPVARRARP